MRTSPSRSRIIKQAERTVERFEVNTEFTPDFPLSGRMTSNGEQGARRTDDWLEKQREEWAREIEADWSGRMETAVAEAEACGYETARKDLEAEYGAREAECVAAVEHLRDLWKEYIEETEPHLVHLAVSIAESLIGGPLPEGVRQASEQAIAEAAEQLATDARMEVHVHPVDFLRLKESGFSEQIAAIHAGLRWNSNPDLSEGEWSVSSPTATLRYFYDELADTLRGRLGAIQEAGTTTL